MDIQHDVTLIHAQILEPFIQRAYRNGAAPGAPPQLAALAADPALAEAVRRLDAWDASTPTGVREGYNAGDVAGVRGAPSADEVASSVAATIYALWRGQILKNTIVAALERVGLSPPPTDQILVALRRGLDTFASSHGVGASGLSFFDVPGLTLAPEAERDLIILASLDDALAAGASPAFAPAFAGSSGQDDCRWGKLHRITFAHPLGGRSRSRRRRLHRSRPRPAGPRDGRSTSRLTIRAPPHRKRSPSPQAPGVASSARPGRRGSSRRRSSPAAIAAIRPARGSATSLACG